MPAIKCISCQHLEPVDGTTKSRCALASSIAQLETVDIKVPYSITSLAMGTLITPGCRKWRNTHLVIDLF